MISSSWSQTAILNCARYSIRYEQCFKKTISQVQILTVNLQSTFSQRDSKGYRLPRHLSQMTDTENGNQTALAQM